MELNQRLAPTRRRGASCPLPSCGICSTNTRWWWRGPSLPGGGAHPPAAPGTAGPAGFSGLKRQGPGHRPPAGGAAHLWPGPPAGRPGGVPAATPTRRCSTAACGRSSSGSAPRRRSCCRKCRREDIPSPCRKRGGKGKNRQPAEAGPEGDSRPGRGLCGSAQPGREKDQEHGPSYGERIAVHHKAVVVDTPPRPEPWRRRWRLPPTRWPCRAGSWCPPR